MVKYFGIREFVCACCGQIEINSEFVHRLDRLREMYGKPIYVSCGYRCEKHNAEVGGVSNSYHTQGLACDIYVDGDYEEFYQLVLDSQLFDGVGYYPDEQFVHIDLRDSGSSPNYYRW